MANRHAGRHHFIELAREEAQSHGCFRARGGISGSPLFRQVARAAVSFAADQFLTGEIWRRTWRLQTFSRSRLCLAPNEVKRRALFVEAAALDQFIFV